MRLSSFLFRFNKVIWSLFFFFLGSSFVWGADVRGDLDIAQQWYVNGETAETLEERNLSFNKALERFLLIRQTLYSGSLDYNIGNCYFQLREYGWAILYYHKALKELPREQRIRQNLAIATEAVGLRSSSSQTMFQKIMVWHDRLSLREKSVLASLLSIVVFVFASLWIWGRVRAFYRLAWLGGVCLTMVLCSTFSSFFLAPTYGILVTSSNVYRDAGEHYARLLEQGLPEGLRLEVLDVQEEGEWIMVHVSGVGTGYVPGTALRLI